ncbi:MAG: alpha/beta hydrolase fold domain-containing protein [Nannocystaceae bacterium]
MPRSQAPANATCSESRSSSRAAIHRPRVIGPAGGEPTWIGVGTCDLFHDEDLAYAAKLRAADVPTTVEVIEGAFRGFDVVQPKAMVSERFFEAQVAAIERALGPR